MGIFNAGQSLSTSAGTPTTTSVNLTTTSANIIAANALRKKIIIYNQSSNTVTALISFKTGATDTESIPLAPGQGWIEEGVNIHTGAMIGKTASGTVSLLVVEWS